MRLLNAQQLRRDVVVVGASAGGLEPAYTLLAGVPVDVPVIIAIVIHRGAHAGPSMLAELLARRTGRPVVEPVEPFVTVPGVIYLAPRDLHMVFERGQVHALRSAKEHFTRPAVDPLFVSAAESYGRRVVGVLLSGGGSDGVIGMVRIKELGGLSLVQRPDEARHPSMPLSALEEDHVDAALPMVELTRVLAELVRGREVATDGAMAGSEGWSPTTTTALPRADRGDPE
jgi:two-component system, chemotaxis family, protein-glutamate methylesterase/glutaminase